LSVVDLQPYRMKKIIPFFLVYLYGISIPVKANKTDSLIIIVELNKGDTVSINCLNELSILYSDTDTLKAKNYALKALALAQKIEYSKGICKAWYNLAYLAEFAYNYTVAEKYYWMGINEAKKTKQPSLQAFGMTDYALTLKKQAKHKEALAINRQALAIYLSLKDTPHIASVYTNLGNNYKNLNQFDKAIEALLQSLKLEQLRNNYNGIAKAYNNIALVYERNGDFHLALQYNLLMLGAAQKGDKKKILATAFGNIGATYQNLKEHKKAIPYMEKALSVYKETNDLLNVALTLNNLSAAHNSIRQFTESIKYSIQCVPIAKESSDIESEAYSYLYLGSAYLGLENRSSAKPNFIKAEQLIEKVNSSAYTMLVHQELSKYYQVIGDFKKALDCHQLLMTEKDTLYSSEKHFQISALQTQYQTAEKEKALAEKSAENLQQSILIEKKNTLLLFSFFGLIAIAFVALLIWRNASLRRAKLMQEKELTDAKSLQRLQEEKLRISRELHDNIGAQLTLINTSLQQIDMTNAAPEIITEAQSMAINTIRELRSIVWLINKEEFYVEELVIKLRDFMKPLQLMKPIVRITTNGGEDYKMNAHTVSNIFRIIQEATNNAIKYAKANQLNILIDTEEKGKLKLLIQDNGKGFETEASNTSFGLKNMAARAQALNGTFELKSKLGIGTEIIVIIPFYA
jgi:signal transduction histidine kinase